MRGKIPCQSTPSSHRSMSSKTSHITRVARPALARTEDHRFQPGQFISIDVPPPHTGRLATRTYSFASSPNLPMSVRLLFNLVPDGAGSHSLCGFWRNDWLRRTNLSARPKHHTSFSTRIFFGESSQNYRPDQRRRPCDISASRSVPNGTHSRPPCNLATAVS